MVRVKLVLAGVAFLLASSNLKCKSGDESKNRKEVQDNKPEGLYRKNISVVMKNHIIGGEMVSLYEKPDSSSLIFVDEQKTAAGRVFYSLKVNYGEQLLLDLSRYSRLYINSGTTVNFFPDNRGEYELNGEACFQTYSSPYVIKTFNGVIIHLDVGSKVNITEYHDFFTGAATSASLIEGVGRITSYSGTRILDTARILTTSQMGKDRLATDGSTKLGMAGHSGILSWINQRFDFTDIQPLDIIQRIARWKIKKIQTTNLPSGSFMESLVFQKGFHSSISELLNEYNKNSKRTTAMASNNDILLKLKN